MSQSDHHKADALTFSYFSDITSTNYAAIEDHWKVGIMEKMVFAYQDPLEGCHVSAFHLFNVDYKHDHETIHFSLASLTCTFEKILTKR